MNMFEKAVRQKLRFDTPRGQLTVEDLWTIPVDSPKDVSLNSIAVELHKQINDNEISFVKKVSTKQELNNLRFEIVKYVIDTRIEGLEKMIQKREKDAEIKTLERLLAQKNVEKMENMTAEEIQKRIDELKTVNV